MPLNKTFIPPMVLELDGNTEIDAHFCSAILYECQVDREHADKTVDEIKSSNTKVQRLPASVITAGAGDPAVLVGSGSDFQNFVES